MVQRTNDVPSERGTYVRPNESPKPENSPPARGRRKANGITAQVGSVVKEVTGKSEWQGGHK